MGSYRASVGHRIILRIDRGFPAFAGNDIGFSIMGVPNYSSASAFSSSQIDHLWSAGIGVAPTSYTLDRSLNGSTGWTNRFTGLATSFSDTGLSANTQYFYRLRALNGAAATGYVTQNATTNSSGVVLIPSSIISGSTFELEALGPTPGGAGATRPAQFGGGFTNNVGGTAPVPEIVATPTYRGNRAAKFYVPGDGVAYRCEYAWVGWANDTGGASTWAPGGPNHIHYVGFAVYLDAAYPITGAAGAVHFQSHVHGAEGGTTNKGTSPAFGIRSRGGSGATWAITEEQDDSVPNQLATFGLIASDRGRWSTFWIKITYSSTATGRYEVWKDGVQVLDRQNIITIRGGNIQIFYYKFGLYPSGMNSGVYPALTSYVDEIRLADSSGNLETIKPENY